MSRGKLLSTVLSALLASSPAGATTSYFRMPATPQAQAPDPTPPGKSTDDGPSGTEGPLSVSMNDVSRPTGGTFAARPAHTGGVGSLTWTLSGALPRGLSFDPGTGAISGFAYDPSPASPYVVTGTDASGAVSSATFLLSVLQAPDMAVAMGTVAGNVGSYLAVGPTVSYAVGAVAWAVSPTLPNGLVLDPTSGTVSGTPTSVFPARSFALTATETDPLSRLRSRTTSFDAVVALPLLHLAVRDVSATAGTYVSANMGSDNSVGPVAYSVSPDLPDGLSLDPSNGTVAGTAAAPSSPAEYALTVSETGPQSPLRTATKSFRLSVDPVPHATMVVSFDDVAGASGEYLTGVATVSNAVGKVTWSVSPELPPGIAVDAASGILSGTPVSVLATTPFVLAATDSATPPGVGRRTFSLTVGPTTRTTGADDLSFRVGQAYDYPLPVSVGMPDGTSYGVFLSGTRDGWTPPPGLALSASGALSGTPTSSSPAVSVFVEATAPDGRVTRTRDFRVAAYPSLALKVPQLVVALDQDTTAIVAMVTGSPGPTGPLTYSLVDGSLPEGLVLNGDGTVVGHVAPDGKVGPGGATVSVSDSEVPAAVGTFHVDTYVAKSADVALPVAAFRKTCSGPGRQDGCVDRASVPADPLYDASDATRVRDAYCDPATYCSVVVDFGVGVLGDSVTTDLGGVTFQAQSIGSPDWADVTGPVFAQRWRLVGAVPGVPVAPGTFMVGLRGKFPARLPLTAQSATVNPPTEVGDVAYSDRFGNAGNVQDYNAVPLSFFGDDNRLLGSPSPHCDATAYCAVTFHMGDTVAVDTADIVASGPYSLEALDYLYGKWFPVGPGGDTSPYFRVVATQPGTSLSVGTARLGFGGLPPVTHGDFGYASESYPDAGIAAGGTPNPYVNDLKFTSFPDLATIYDADPATGFQVSCDPGHYCFVIVSFAEKVVADGADSDALGHAKLQAYVDSGNWRDVTPSTPVYASFYRLVALNPDDHFTVGTFRVGYLGIYPPYRPSPDPPAQ